MTAPQIVDDDLVLRGLRDDDIEHVLAYATSPGFFEHIEVPDRLRRTHTRGDAKDFLHEAARRWATGHPTWAIESEGRFAGTIRLRRAAWRAGEEVGFGLAPWSRGRGAATRALHLVLAWCRREHRAAPWARCKNHHLPSVRVLERCSFEEDHREGDWICWRPPSEPGTGWPSLSG